LTTSYRNFVDAEINECQSSPCVNGSCQDFVDNYSCHCLDGFTGRNCEIGKNHSYFYAWTYFQQ